ncbi:MAG: hypothetical protein U1E46_10850 [Hyphomicrobiales bacterium]
MDILSIILQLVGGAVGGNAAGGILKNQSLGGAGNSIAGAIGGIILGQVVSRLTHGAVSADAVAAATQGMDFGAIISNLASSGVGGALLTAIVGALKNR